MNPQKRNFLISVLSLLQYHKTIGITAYQDVEGLSTFMQSIDVPYFESTGKGSVTIDASDLERGDDLKSGSTTCREIADEVRGCTNCDLRTKRLSAVPGDGGMTMPKLLIVGGWLSGEKEGAVGEKDIFGKEEDAMVSRMITAINLSPEKVFVTNVVKCSLPEDCQPSNEQIHTCFSYLRRQIHILNPDVICTMGVVAAKALLKSTKALSLVRGRVFPFEVSGRRTIPVVPTYHPTFLLKNPDFKRATWGDLQVVAKHLRQ